MSIELTDNGYPYCTACGEGFNSMDQTGDHGCCCFENEEPIEEDDLDCGMRVVNVRYYQQLAIDRLATADCIIQPGWWFDETLATVPANQIGHLAIGCAAVLSGEALRQALVYGWPWASSTAR